MHPAVVVQASGDSSRARTSSAKRRQNTPQVCFVDLFGYIRDGRR